jgi:hypothetical protein
LIGVDGGREREERRVAKMRIGTIAVLPIAMLGALACALLPATGRLPLALPTASAQCVPGSVTYYGEQYAGDAFVWCLDRSGSTAWGGLLDDLVAEVSTAIAGLAPEQQFSIVAFGSSTTVFSSALLPADPANVSDALVWLQLLTPQGGTCLADAGVASLGILQGSTATPALFVTADGEPNCPGPTATLSAITGANGTGIPIHAIYVESDAGGIAFMQQLAVMNGGTFLQPGGPLGVAPPMAQFPGVPIRRGDVDADGQLTIADPIRILLYGFGVDCAQICRDAADVTDDGVFEPLSDAVTLLGALFVPGHPPVPPPTGACGDDPTPDGLSCFGVVCQ